MPEYFPFNKDRDIRSTTSEDNHINLQSSTRYQEEKTHLWSDDAQLGLSSSDDRTSSSHSHQQPHRMNSSNDKGPSNRVAHHTTTDMFSESSDTSSSRTKSSSPPSQSYRKMKRRAKRKLARADFERVIHLTQKDAARELDVCLSSFKRQLRRLRPKLQWPRKSGYRQKIIVPKHDVELQNRLSSVIEENEKIDTSPNHSAGPALMVSSKDRQMASGALGNKYGTNNSSNRGHSLFPSLNNGTSSAQQRLLSQQSPRFPQSTMRVGPSMDTKNHNAAPSQYSPEDMEESQANTPHWNQQYVCFTNHDKWLHHQANILRELQRQANTFPPRPMSNTGYRGDINSFMGPWNSLFSQQNTVALSLLDKDMHLLASNSLFQQFTGYTVQDFLYGFNLSFLHLPTIPREKFVEIFQKLLTASSINMVEFTTVVEHKSGAFIALHVVFHTLAETRMFWIEYRLAYKFMPKVVFKNSITKKERKTRSIEKPVAQCTRDEMILDDFQTKSALSRGTDKVEIHDQGSRTVAEGTDITSQGRTPNVEDGASTPQSGEMPDISNQIRSPPAPHMYSMDDLLKEGLEDYLS